MTLWLMASDPFSNLFTVALASEIYNVQSACIQLYLEFDVVKSILPFTAVFLVVIDEVLVTDGISAFGLLGMSTFVDARE